MGYRETLSARRSLASIAALQGGYFTSKQAREAGYAYPHVTYHVNAGNFERVGVGLYRLPEIPRSEHDELVRLSLWSRDRGDAPQAVVSHASALALHGLGGVMPSAVDLTVPPSFRKPALPACRLHRARVPANDVEHREGFDVTRPLRTLLDVAGGDNVTQEQVARALAEAIDRGLVRRRAIEDLAARVPAAQRLREALPAHA